MAERVLSQRELNRTLLERQLLLERADIKPLTAIERLAGMQGEVSKSPYIGLWTRLKNFKRDDLTKLIETRKVVRATMMRSTLHLVSADDYRQFRPRLQPALSRALRMFYGRKAAGLDIDALIAAAQPFIEEAPHTLAELREFLATVEPDRDPETMAYAVRTHLPMLQKPPGGLWASGKSPAYITAESWLDQPLDASVDPELLIMRYLAAFGPASVMDIQAWTGLIGLKMPLEAFKSKLQRFRDEKGRDLFDVSDAPLPPEDTPAPIRFIPGYDNLIISHADRTRVISDVARKKVFLSAARVLATFLVDGFVAGTWKIEREKNTAALVITPFETLNASDSAALEKEGESLFRFVEDDADDFEVRFA